jgi:hypothetical protein
MHAMSIVAEAFGTIVALGNAMRIKSKILGTCTIIGLAVLGGIDRTSASTIVLTWPSGYGDFPDGGGEFTAVTSDHSLVNSYNSKATRLEGGVLGFQTFCIEYTEEFYPGQTYTYEISPNARNGGASVGPDGTPGSDPVSVGTAYLYSQFAQGILSGYNYTPGSGPGSREESARSLQNLIWFLEGERTAPLSDALTTGWLNELNAHFGIHANEKIAVDNILNHSVTAGDFGVFALNTGPNLDTPYNVQDQLLYVPDGGSSFLMLGISIFGMHFVQRRLRKSS